MHKGQKDRLICASYSMTEIYVFRGMGTFPGGSNSAIFIFCIPSQYGPRTLVAQWVNCWPADLVILGTRPAVGRTLFNGK